MKKFRYTAEQLDFIRTAYMSMPANEITKVFNKKFGLKKTDSAIRSVLKNYKITCCRKVKDRFIKRKRILNEGQEQFLREKYPKMQIPEMTRAFNDHFEVTMTEQQIKSYVQNHKITSGRTGCFQKGNAPWNDGTKGKGLTGANKGSFKKGSVPANRKPIGTERIGKDGFIEIKVAERNPYTGFPTRYKHKHIHIYEQKNGPVPEGMVVAFKDSDRRNFDPDNFMLISRAELLRLNKYGYKEMPGELKPSVVALTKLQVKTCEISKEVTA
jgi:hypothetical protein